MAGAWAEVMRVRNPNSLQPELRVWLPRAESVHSRQLVGRDLVRATLHVYGDELPVIIGRHTQRDHAVVQRVAHASDFIGSIAEFHHTSKLIETGHPAQASVTKPPAVEHCARAVAACVCLVKLEKGGMHLHSILVRYIGEQRFGPLPRLGFAKLVLAIRA
jgi:hypothetical protein